MNIVIGLDTTPAAAEALRWAAWYARAVGGDLHAVHAFLWPDGKPVILPTSVIVVGNSGALPRPVEPPADVSRLFASVQPEATWTLQCFAGDPGALLRKLSEDADLLVVGTGDHVGLGRRLVGSVSHYCLSHAKCPVVAVPAPNLIAEVAGNADALARPVSEAT